MFNEPLYLERIDRTRNMTRYYRLSAVETLFGDWAVVREWGRIGRRGQTREESAPTRQSAERLIADYAARRLRRGYVEP